MSTESVSYPSGGSPLESPDAYGPMTVQADTSLGGRALIITWLTNAGFFLICVLVMSISKCLYRREDPGKVFSQARLLKKTFGKLALAQNDVQTIFAIALMSVTFTRLGRHEGHVSMYHLRIVGALLELSLLQHALTMLLFKHKFKKTMRVKIFRGIPMFVVSLGALVFCGHLAHTWNMPPSATFSLRADPRARHYERRFHEMAFHVILFLVGFLLFTVGSIFYCWRYRSSEAQPGERARSEKRWVIGFLWTSALLAVITGAISVGKTLSVSDALGTANVDLQPPGDETKMGATELSGIALMSFFVVRVLNTYFEERSGLTKSAKKRKEIEKRLKDLDARLEKANRLGYDAGAALRTEIDNLQARNATLQAELEGSHLGQAAAILQRASARRNPRQRASEP